MKKNLLVLIICFLITDLFSQSNYNNALHNARDISGDMVSLNSKNYYLKSVQGCCSNRIYLTGVDANGQTLFSNDVSTGFDYDYKLVATADNYLLILAKSMVSCDVAMLSNVVSKFDTSGVLIFRENLEFTNASAIAPSQDSGFYISSDIAVTHYKKDGQKKYTYFPDYQAVSDLTSIHLLSGGDLLWHGKINGVWSNMIYDLENETPVVQQNSAYTIEKFSEFSNGKIIGLSSTGKLLSYDTALVALNESSSLFNAGMIVEDFVLRHDSVFVTGFLSGAHSLFYAVLDENLNTLFSSQSSYKLVKPTAISLNNKNTISILSTGSSTVSQNEVTFTGLFQTGINGSFQTAADIGVLSFSVTDAYYRSLGNNYYDAVVDLSVEIKNYGTDTVKSFYLNHYGGSIQMCPVLYHTLQSLIIPPGGSVTVQTGTFIASAVMSQVSLTPPLNICPFTTIPNSKNDGDASNDAQCMSVQAGITGISQNDLIDQQIHMYPNPFRSGFTVTSEFEMFDVKVYDSYGKLIRSQDVNSKSYTYSNQELSSGIYFIKIQTEKETVVKKIIKE